jgi:hypothetical protein
MWTVRQRESSQAWGIDFVIPEPSPPPVTTIAWRIGHLLVGVFGARLARHFGGPPVTFRTYDYRRPPRRRSPGSMVGMRSGSPVSGRSMPMHCWPLRGTSVRAGPDGGPGVAHHREVIHHGAEISLLRDLYAWRL